MRSFVPRVLVNWRCVSQAPGGAGPKTEVKNPLKGCTDPVMAWYGALPADQQKKARIGGGCVHPQLARTHGWFARARSAADSV